ncbi:MAG: protein translocase SEC61 complex subunit gamma [Candidatus Methanofastidiosa archaeon]|nr:protein translocase SEC61 complex subunit gamma [Candidatus Methanofastidiosa archaeon]
MEQEKKGISQTLRGYKKVLRLTKRPDKKEYMQISKVCVIGICIIAIIGFLIKIISSLIQGATL